MSAARAAEDTQERTLEAISRALGFLESAPRNGDFVVAVVYDADAPGGALIAESARARLENQPGPKRTRLRAAVYEVDDLIQSGDRIDALLLTSDAGSDFERVAEFVSQRRVLSVSNDPACLEAGSCVLMVSAGRDVEIILDTQLAGQVGAEFSAVFTMMVTRR